MVSEILQYEVYWISQDSTLGSEIAKTRPCVVVSPNELNQFLPTIIIAPITSTIKSYPWRVECMVGGRKGAIATDKMKVIDKVRIGSKISALSKQEITALKDVMRKMLID
ncbi:type II toxin-antitoxin system PemK/MazF family toxin [Dyadobacter arcticus]|uniref:mRNA interferase MazF n=1 Tax=Dyadobacter arcticus TaxID=1078754 RepID=A0ABX0UGX2_9BACT|nr:type II toxin-antitoxin system PemK/MazF family toxin [Dyadobacter arcticus]NIJ52263.1 mRNA interferase MazF [Dyadobacter arcticus]